MRRSRSWLLAVTALMLFATFVLPSTVVGAQCTPRQDWVTQYTIVRGDHLARIAQRYGVSLADLAAGNCIANANVIYAGQVIRVPAAGQVVPTTPPVTQPNAVSVPATYQNYDAGVLIYRADNGQILVLANNGTALGFDSRTYGALADNSYLVQNPSGRMIPSNGFGKVWSNYPLVRSLVGFPVTNEAGFVTAIGLVSGGVSVSLPDGRVAVVSGDRWSVGSGTVPPATQPQIAFFNADVASVTVGQNVNLAWDVRNASSTVLEIYDQQSPGAIAMTYTNLPVAGSLSYRVPETFRGGVRLVLTAVTPSGQRSVNQTILITITVPPVTGPVTRTVPASFQQFQNGFMVWRADSSDIIVYGSNGVVHNFSAAQYSHLGVNPYAPVGPNLIPALNGFGKVYSNFVDIQRGLGYPIGYEQGYTLNINVVTSGVEYRINLPNGSIIRVLNNSTWSIVQ